ADDDVSALGGRRETRRHVRGRARGGEGPALRARSAQLGCAEQCLARVDPDVELHCREHARVLLVQLERLLADGEGRAGGVERVVLLAAPRIAAGPLEDDHEAIARRLVHVAVLRPDDLEEAGKIRLDELVESLGLELLAEARVAGDVEEEDGDLLVPLLERRRRGIPLEQILYGVRDELAEL